MKSSDIKKSDVIKRMELVQKALRNGDYSDNAYERLEIELNQLTTLVKSLLPDEPQEPNVLDVFKNTIKL